MMDGRSARFELAQGYPRNEWLRDGGLALAMLLFGLGMAVYGAYQTSALLEVARIWRDGIESSGEVGYGGDVVTHYAILKRYDLEVTFLPEGDETPTTFEAAFTRFFSGPDEGDEMIVKYDASAPTRAVCSWQYEALLHGWIWVSLVWLLAFSGMLTFVLVTRELTSTIAKIKQLAHEGQLMRADVEEAKYTGTEKMPLLVLRYKTARGELTKQTFHLKRGEPYFVNERQQVLVLSTFNERSSHALRADGYPLATKPALES
jgi:hypothetical protein